MRYGPTPTPPRPGSAKAAETATSTHVWRVTARQVLDDCAMLRDSVLEELKHLELRNTGILQTKQQRKLKSLLKILAEVEEVL